MSITGFFEKQPRRVLIPFGIALLVAVAIADLLVRTELLQLSVFYLLPISFFTWFLGLRWGVVLALVSAGWLLRVNLLEHRLPGTIPYWDTLIWLILYLGSVGIIFELRTLYLRERDLSRIDPLTRLPNRRAFFEFAEIETSRARRHREPVTLVYFDIDDFKGINDRLGHAAGDEVLMLAARVTQGSLRRSDLAARMGGDEFAIFLPQADWPTAETVLNRVHNALRSAMQRHRWPVTFSMGAVTFLAIPSSLDEMVRIADQAMYAAKNGGKDRLEKREFAA